MRRAILAGISIAVIALVLSCSERADDYSPEKIIGLERAALDRWSNGDPKGYLELYSPDITYFDPSREKRVDGLEAMTQLLAPITGKIKIDRYEILNPKVQRDGDVATLSYNFISYRKQPNGSERVLNKWNNTEVFQRLNGTWKIVHSHWSFTTPELKQPPSAS
jgi:ketosteroid isomerase-like protein